MDKPKWCCWLTNQLTTLVDLGTAGVGRVVRLCEVRHRRTVVYSSLRHELIIRLHSTDLNATATRGQRLFLHYEGTWAADTAPLTTPSLTKQDRNSGNSRIAVELSRASEQAEVHRRGSQPGHI